MPDIDFEKDLPAYFRRHFPKLSVQSAASLQISKVLNIANDRLLSAMADAKKKSLLHASQFAADAVLPKYVLRLAKSEAMRQLALYEIGFLDYSGARMDGGRRMPTSRRVVSKGPKKKASASKKAADPVTGLRVKRRPQVASPFTAFSVGVSRLHHLSHSYLSMEKQGAQYLSSCLYYFMKGVAAKLALQELKKQAGPVEIRNVLEELLSPGVFRTAISEGNKCLLLHENDLIKFDPRDVQKQDPKMFSSPIETHCFRPGVSFLLHFRFARPFAAVDNSSEYVEHVLLEVARLFAAEVGGNCTRNQTEFMDENDVRAVMEDVLPGELRRHAVARAVKALADYVAETSELYHSSIAGDAGGFPEMAFKRKSSAAVKSAKRVKVTKSRTNKSSDDVKPTARYGRK